MEKSRDEHTFLVQCPNCGSEVHIKVTYPRALISRKLRVQSLVPLSSNDQIVLRGNAAFEVEAGMHEWSVFKPVTEDVGVDYVVAKKYGALMVQLKTATRLTDGRYHTTLNPFSEGPLGFIVYYYQNDKTFFLIPSVEFWEIPRFKALKEKVFAQGEYRDIMSIELAREVMGDYEGEKGWARLEQLTTIEGLLAVEKFKMKRKE